MSHRRHTAAFWMQRKRERREKNNYRKKCGVKWTGLRDRTERKKQYLEATRKELENLVSRTESMKEEMEKECEEELRSMTTPLLKEIASLRRGFV